ncbi:MAG: CbiM family transporter [Zavarzinella sp.]
MNSPLFAVHIADSILSTTYVEVGYLLATLLIAVGSYRFSESDIVRVGMLSAVFFVASTINIRVGPTSVHLLMNGLLGVILGRKAVLAISIGLLLQVLLLAHGGYSSLGCNIVIISLPALMAGSIFRFLRKTPMVAGALAGAFAVTGAVVLNWLVLVAGGNEDWRYLATVMGFAHLPIIGIEAAIVGATVKYLAKAKPELLGIQTTETGPVKSL